MKGSYEKVLNRLHEEIESEMFKEQSRMSEKDFTRNRIWKFTKLVMFQIYRASKSLSVEIYGYLTRWFTEESTSKQALSQARQKIKWEGYEHLNNEFVKSYYQEVAYKTYKGYLLVAADGTSYQAPAEKDITEKFGIFQKGICLIGCVKIYDVMNRIQIASTFGSQGSEQGAYESEGSLFEKTLEKFKGLINREEQKVVMIGDRNYPCYYYFHELEKSGINYLFRCSKTFCTEVQRFAKQGGQDEILEIALKKYERRKETTAKRITDKSINCLRVRCVALVLNTGEIAYLLTNISQTEMSGEELGKLYWYRWEIEKAYDVDKNKIELENFSCKTANGVLQELYAGMVSFNISQMVIAEAQEKLEEQMSEKAPTKYQYQINRSVAIGIVRQELPVFLTKKIPLQEWFDNLVKEVIKHKEPVKPNRRFPKKRKNKHKYPLNRRPYI